MAMEFWGVEVKQGQSLKVTPEDDRIIHISQASMGEVKDDKGANKVPLRLKIGEKNFVIGTLSAGDRPQIMFDLVFEKEFELSHDWKNGSVYFIGYQTMDPCLDDEDDGEEFPFESDEDLPLEAPENGKLEPNVADVKPKVDGVKPGKKPSATEVVPSKKIVVKPADPKKAESESDDDDDSDDEDEDGEDSDESMEDGESSDEGDSDDSEEDDSDEETPVKGKPQIKKRPAEPLPETRAPAKKAKQATPTGGKKVAPGGKQPQKSPQSFNNSNKKPQKKFNQRKH